MVSETTKLMVPMEVAYQPAWLTWVASTTTCLKALDVDCDLADVAGMSGYAFVMAIHEELCPSGPTMFDWGMLDHGVNVLGRSTMVFGTSDCHIGEHANDRTRAHCREAFEIVAREIEAGRPCVIWGAYVPEFAAAYGVEGEAFLVKSFREVLGEPQPPVPYDGIEAPGGPYVMAFPTPTKLANQPAYGDRFAVGQAVQQLRGRSAFHNYGYGLAAYDAWISALDAGKLDDFGNAYNAQCWAEARAFARTFLERVTARNAARAEPLGAAAEAYATVASALAHVAELFPFPASGQTEDPERRQGAIEALREAQAAETTAVEALEQAVGMDWDA
jgi:hypothetical protein